MLPTEEYWIGYCTQKNSYFLRILCEFNELLHIGKFIARKFDCVERTKNTNFYNAKNRAIL
jgi:hypothetical protein